MSVLGSHQGRLPNVIIKVHQKGFGTDLLETKASSNQVVLDDKRENSILQNHWNGNLSSSHKNVTVKEIVSFVVITNL